MLFGIIGLPFLPVYNDMQFKTVTRLNARNEWTLLGIGGYDINRLNTDLKNPDDHQNICSIGCRKAGNGVILWERPLSITAITGITFSS